jgi:hypothetical protein
MNTRFYGLTSQRSGRFLTMRIKSLHQIDTIEPNKKAGRRIRPAFEF